MRNPLNSLASESLNTLPRTIQVFILPLLLFWSKMVMAAATVIYCPLTVRQALRLLTLTPCLQSSYNDPPYKVKIAVPVSQIRKQDLGGLEWQMVCPRLHTSLLGSDRIRSWTQVQMALKRMLSQREGSALMLLTLCPYRVLPLYVHQK